MRLTVLSFFLMLMLATAGGCGIKPGKVEPPQGAEKDTFPQIYPNPATSVHR